MSQGRRTMPQEGASTAASTSCLCSPAAPRRRGGHPILQNGAGGSVGRGGAGGPTSQAALKADAARGRGWHGAVGTGGMSRLLLGN
uniref:Uncharacterized protein n=1 Tax=Oryza brachyantha TaxID=4533 RepID=J3MRH9_ORYBR